MVDPCYYPGVPNCRTQSGLRFFVKLMIKSVLSGTVALSVVVMMASTLISTVLCAADMQLDSVGHTAEPRLSENAPMLMNEVVVDGVVKRVLAGSGQIMVKHQPIPEWNMSAMQMKFNLADGLSVTDFTEGQSIRFRLKQSSMMTFTIVKLLN